MPRDITVTFADGSQTIYKGAPDDVTPEQVTARAMQEFGKEVAELDGGRKGGALEAVKEVGRVVDKGVRKGLAALPGFFGDLAAFGFKNINEAPAGQLGPGGALVQAASHFAGNPFKDLKFGDVTKTLETAGGTVPVSEPTTSGGKAIANVLEPTVGVMAGGGVGTLGQKAAIGMMSGIGGEGAARVFGDNPLTRFLGSLFGGGAAGIAQNVKGNAKNIVREATSQMTDADWRRAKVLEATLNENDIPHLKSQLLGPRSTLANTVAVANTNPAVSPRLQTAVANSADKGREALSAKTMQHLPVGVGERKGILHDVQEAATNVLRGIRERANSAYQAKMPPEGSQYPEDFIEATHAALVQLAKSSKYGETTDAGKAILRIADDLYLPGGKWDTSGVNPVALARAQKAGIPVEEIPGAVFKRTPVTDQHQINNLIKELNLKATKDDYKGLPIEEVKKLLKELTPEFADARAAKTAVMQGEFNPTSQGLTGDLARMGGGVKPDRIAGNDQALSIVFPKDRAQPQAIAQLGKNLGGDSVGQLLREHLARNMEQAASLKSSTGETAQAPFRFIEAIAGTHAQRQNLEAALMVAAKANKSNPAAVRNGFYKLMRAFESFKDLKLPDSIDRAALTQQAGKSVMGFTVAPQSRLGRAFWEKATAKTYNEIADLILAPDGLKKLEAIAKSKSPDTARQVAIGVLMSTGAGADQAD